MCKLDIRVFGAPLSLMYRQLPAIFLQHKIRKILRYLRIYGPGRVFFKVAGRMRWSGFGHMMFARDSQRDIGVIGCGQFAFATIGYHLMRSFGRRFCRCYDVSATAARSFSAFYRIDECASPHELIAMPEVRYVYIASNHASHTPYAVAALQAGKIVFIEKPVAVSRQQLAELSEAIRETGGTAYAGYNRPFSGAIKALKQHCSGAEGPLTLACFVSGHKLAEDHWYRRPAEGTRICGNVGHWLDLAVHILAWRILPDKWIISVLWSDDGSRDDDVCISLASERGDLVTITLTARTEPFEGINETINLQWGNVIAKIDDFRRLEVWQGERRWQRRYWPKDVGHRGSIMQPFSAGENRWWEVELSSLLMLHIADMVKGRQQRTEFSFEAAQRACL